jgi:hypothetical protein
MAEDTFDVLILIGRPASARVKSSITFCIFPMALAVDNFTSRDWRSCMILALP